jgi:hypothetical protein
MFRPTDFLLQECENVRNLLRNTLRYAYSSKSSNDVYTECVARLELLEAGFRTLEDDDVDELQEYWFQLSKLSKLVGRIERSHIEEFSWPFAQALQALAIRVCAGTGVEPDKPLFFISADDELSSYQVDTEQNEPGLIKRPLFNIIFPRSLKNSVLLHPILGHEVGHAAFAIPMLFAELKAAVVDKLVTNSPLADRSKFEQWIACVTNGTDPDFDLDEALLLWPEELYCDLFGLLMMGPSYVGAHCSLLLPFDMKEASGSHPPGLTRRWMLNEAVATLKWKKNLAGDSALSQPVKSYFSSLTKTATKANRDFRLLDPRQIRLALNALTEFLKPMGPAICDLPSIRLLKSMVSRLLTARPPVASSVSASLQISNEFVDFRWILFAGWLAWHSEQRRKEDLTFTNLNLLCDRGIQLQTAVDCWAAHKQPGKSVSANN